MIYISKQIYLAAFLLLLSFAQASAAGGDTAVIKGYLRSAMKYTNTAPDTAMKLANKAYQLALQAEDHEMLASTYYAFAELYSAAGNPQLAVEYCFRGLKQFEYPGVSKETVSYYKNIVKIYSELGFSYFDLKKKDLSLDYFNKAVTLIDETNLKIPGTFSDFTKMRMLYNAGSLFLAFDENTKAKIYFLNAQEINKIVKDSATMAGLLANFGLILKNTGKPDEALPFYLQSLEIRRRIDDPRGLISILNNIGEYYGSRNDFIQSKKYLDEALALGKRSGIQRSVQITADNLVVIYLKAGDYKNAFAMQKLSNQLNDSIFNNQNTTNVANMALQYEYDRQIKQQELEQQKKIDEQKQKKVFFILLSALFLLLTIAISLLLIIQRNKTMNAQLLQKQLDLEGKNLRLEKENLQNELSNKNKELATNVLYLVKKNEFITDIAHRLKSLSSQQPENISQLSNNMIADLIRNTDDKVWKEFEVRFQEVHQDFYRRLNERFPELTPNEKKLAAFLRLNMSTKDISAITFQSPDSIRIARSRLRKKMELPSDDNLIGFLESI